MKGMTLWSVPDKREIDEYKISRYLTICLNSIQFPHSLYESEAESRSVVSDSLWPQEPYMD